MTLLLHFLPFALVFLWLLQEPSVTLWSRCVAFISVPLFREVWLCVRKHVSGFLVLQPYWNAVVNLCVCVCVCVCVCMRVSFLCTKPQSQHWLDSFDCGDLVGRFCLFSLPQSLTSHTTVLNLSSVFLLQTLYSAFKFRATVKFEKLCYKFTFLYT